MSRSGSLGKETAKGIADAAMLEVASISVGPMVCYLEARSPTLHGDNISTLYQYICKVVIRIYKKKSGKWCHMKHFFC